MRGTECGTLEHTAPALRVLITYQAGFAHGIEQSLRVCLHLIALLSLLHTSQAMK